MKAFRFSLQSLLTLREEREQAAQQHYARMLRALAGVDAALATVEQHLAALAGEQHARLQVGLPANELERLGHYRLALEERQLRLQQERTHAQSAAELARTALLQATQARQALENYRQKLHRAYAYSVARAEQQRLDDLAGRPGSLASAWREAAESPAS
jgi:flagellar export protein FliJ